MEHELTSNRIGLIATDLTFERSPDVDEGEETALHLDTEQLGLWVFLATVTMLFAGFTSAILVRRTSSDWQPIPLPGLLWLNTALLLLSSVTMERVRALARNERWASLKGWLIVTTLLGVLFVAGQVEAWRQLASEGVYLPGNPHSSFFYILTGAHAAHLLGGVFALVYLLTRTLGSGRTPTRARVNLCATYWHFVDGLWVFLFVMLFVL